MGRRKTELRNEVKSRVSDDVYDALKRVQNTRGFESESKAISYLLEVALFGMTGASTLPRKLTDNSPELAQCGPGMSA